MTTYEHDKRSSVIPLLVGFLLGVGLALVLSPKSGRQLRRDLNRGAQRAKSTVEETVDLVKAQGKEVLEVAEEAIQEAKQAFEVGRSEAKESVRGANRNLD